MKREALANNAIVIVTESTLSEKRFSTANFETCYYTPEIHIASFALPQYILKAIEKDDSD